MGFFGRFFGTFFGDFFADEGASSPVTRVSGHITLPLGVAGTVSTEIHADGTLPLPLMVSGNVTLGAADCTIDGSIALPLRVSGSVQNAAPSLDAQSSSGFAPLVHPPVHVDAYTRLSLRARGRVHVIDVPAIHADAACHLTLHGVAIVHAVPVPAPAAQSVKPTVKPTVKPRVKQPEAKLPLPLAVRVSRRLVLHVASSADVRPVELPSVRLASRAHLRLEVVGDVSVMSAPVADVPIIDEVITAPASSAPEETVAAPASLTVDIAGHIPIFSISSITISNGSPAQRTQPHAGAAPLPPFTLDDELHEIALLMHVIRHRRKSAA